jgi:hypothetical protein
LNLAVHKRGDQGPERRLGLVFKLVSS